MAIEIFFDWLSTNLTHIYSDKNIQSELSKQLKKLNPDILWEIGPGLNAANFFAFSPNLDEELLSFTKLLVSEAPNIPDWEFLPAKPRKRWKRRNIKINCNNKIQTFNFDNCRYTLTSFNNGEFFDVNLIPDFEQEISISDIEFASELFVEFELGEELYLKLIDKVNILSDKQNGSTGNDVEDLYDHLMSVKK